MSTNTVNFSESPVPNAFSSILSRDYQLAVNDVHVGEMYDSIFESIASFLGKIKHTESDKPVGLKVEDTKGNVLAIALVQHTLGSDDPEDSGNYNLSFVVDPKEIETLSFEEGDLKSIHDSAFFTLFAMVSAHHRFQPTSRASSSICLFMAFKVLLDVLDQYAVEGKTYEICRDNTFIASVGVEDGEKVKSIVPGDFIKTLIKDDASLERSDS